MSKGSCKDIDSEEREPMIDTAVILKRFEEPDEVRTFDKGRFEIVRIGGMSIGRATYEAGWKWSEHVGPAFLSRDMQPATRNCGPPST